MESWVTFWFIIAIVIILCIVGYKFYEEMFVKTIRQRYAEQGIEGGVMYDMERHHKERGEDIDAPRGFDPMDLLYAILICIGIYFLVTTDMGISFIFVFGGIFGGLWFLYQLFFR